MNVSDLNYQAVQIVCSWDPFGLGHNAYETESADVVSALHGINDPNELAIKIQAIYEHSYEKWISMEQCMELSDRLLNLKHALHCDLPSK